MNILENYSNFFGYEKFLAEPSEHTKNHAIYLKRVDKGLIVIEKVSDNKYVNFYFNKDKKVFKESDLFLAVLENCPVAWEEER